MVPHVLLMRKSFLKDAVTEPDKAKHLTTTLVPSPKELQVGARCYLRGVGGWLCPRQAPAAGTGVSTGLEPVLHPNASPCLSRGCALYTSPELCSCRGSLAPSPSPHPPQLNITQVSPPCLLAGSPVPQRSPCCRHSPLASSCPPASSPYFQNPQNIIGMDGHLPQHERCRHGGPQRGGDPPPPGTTLSQWTGGYRPLAQAPHIPPQAPPHPGHGREGA